MPVSLFLMFFFTSIVLFIGLGGQTVGADDAKVVQLYVDGKEQVVPTRAKTVGDLLDRLDIKVKTVDIVEPSLDTKITNKGFQLNVYHARKVAIEDEGQRIVTNTAEPDPERIAEKAGLKIYPEDIVTKKLVDIAQPVQALRSGLVTEEVIIKRATLVHFNLYGEAYTIRTHADSVGELLENKEVKTLEDDTVQPSPDTPISHNLQIFVVRKGKKVVTQEENIDPSLERREDPNADLGTTVVIKPGRAGRRVVTYEIKLENGKEVERREIQSVIIEEPVERVIKVGTKRHVFSGSFEAALAALRGCESGGNYSINTGNGYYGAYQYNLGTWNNYNGYKYPNKAPKYVQDQKAWETYQGRGWQPWPGCTAKLGLQDVYR